MELRNWALIGFTILLQMSVGAFIVFGIVHFWAARKLDMKEADRLSNYGLLAIGPLLVLALVASLFHLGSPLNAPRAVTNIGSSWLSREVLFSVLFTVVGGIFAVMQWRARLAALPADSLKLKGRGYLRPDYFADVVVFDPASVQDHATAENPHQLSEGMVHVFVNGTQVLSEGEHSGNLPGRVVRGPGWTGWK